MLVFLLVGKMKIMKLFAVISITILITTACNKNIGNEELITEAFPKEKAAYQQKIVGHLSGEYALANQILMAGRWSPDERILAKEYLKELIKTLGIEPQEHNYVSPNLNPAIDLILEPFNGTNIYGILEATSKSEEYVVLGAHYDTGKRNAPGAIDNATGIALIYSVVHELAKINKRGKNVVIVFFDQEEEELIGSKAFAKLLQKKEWEINSIHCFDMVGWDADKDKAMEIYSASESLIKLYRRVAKSLNIPLNEILINLEGYDNSSTDFDAFIPAGYNVIGAGECYYHKDSTPYKDSPEDTFETVDFDYLLSCSNLIESIIKEIVIP